METADRPLPALWSMAQRPLAAYVLLAGGPLAVTPFVALWLRGHGAPIPMLGIMLALPLLARLALAQPLAAWATRFASGWPPMAVMSALATLAAIIGSLSDNLVIALTAWTVASIGASACMPILDGIVLRSRYDAHSSISLGRAKAAGSLAYLLSTVTIGVCTARFGCMGIMPWAAGTGALASLYLTFSAQMVPEASPLPCANQAVLPVSPAAGGPPLSLALLAIILVEASHGLHAIAMIGWQARGLGTEVNGALWATGTLCDVLFLAFGGWLYNRIRPERLLVLGATAATVRWMGFALSPSLPMLFLLQGLHALSFTATSLAGVQITQALSGRRTHECKHESTGRGSQIVTWATSTGLAGGFATIAAGPLLVTFGVQGYWLMAVLAAAGLVTAIFFEQAMARNATHKPRSGHHVQRDIDAGAAIARSRRPPAPKATNTRLRSELGTGVGIASGFFGRILF